MQLKLKPSQLLALAVEYIKARRPFLVIGSPGTAKTSIITQASEIAGADIAVTHLPSADPTDAKGLPWSEPGQKYASFRLFGEAARVVDSKKTIVWFWDDMGPATAAVQAAFMPWLLARRNGEHELPEHATVIGATNLRTDRGNVTSILEPVKSRFDTIVHLIPDVQEWCNWAVTKPFMLPEVIAYIRFQPDALNQFQASADLENSPCPRTWENASRALMRKLPADVEAAAVNGAIGDGQGGQLLAFIQMFRQLPSIDGILMDPDNADLPKQSNVRYAVVTGVAARVTEQNFTRASRYAERLEAAGYGDFAALLIRDAMRRKPKLQQTPTFVKLMSGPLGQLIGGGA